MVFIKDYFKIRFTKYVDTLALVAASIDDGINMKFKSIIERLKKQGIDYGSDTELFLKSTQNYLYIPKYDNDRIKHQLSARSV